MFHLILLKWQPFIFVFALILLLGWETVTPFFSIRKRVEHGIKNLFLSGLNTVILLGVFAGLIVADATMVDARQIGVINWLGVPYPWNGILAFFALDIWTYWWHRFNHVVPFLWRFHRMHHSDPEMDVTTATRFHFGEITFSTLIRLLLIPLIGIPLWALIVYDILLLVSTQFHHANIYLPASFDRALRFVIVTPFMHKVHHSNIQRETDSNFTSIFSFWDRVFRSYRERENYREIHFGVEGYSGDEEQTLPNLILSPLGKR